MIDNSELSMSNSGLVEHVTRFIFSPFPSPKPSVLLLDQGLAENALAKFFREFAPRTLRIRDATELEAEKSNIHRQIKFILPSKVVGSWIDAILRGFSVSEAGWSYGVQGLLSHQQATAATISLPKVVIIHEDDISQSQIADFFSLFQEVTPERRPVFVFIPSTDQAEALRKLAVCGHHIAPYVLSPSGPSAVSLRSEHCTDFHEFLQLFVSEGDGICGITTSSDLQFEDHPDERLNACLVDLVRVQSLFRQGRRFEAPTLLHAARSAADEIVRTSSNAQRRHRALRLRAIANLWRAYIYEGELQDIEDSIDIATRLGDQVLLAHALKLTALKSGFDTQNRRSLEKALQIYESVGASDQALFVRNNLLVDTLYSSRDPRKSAEDLSEYVNEATPYIRRSTTFHSNAGIAFMLYGQEERAIEFFDRAVAGAGPPLNKINSIVNFLVARHIHGDRPDRDEIFKIFIRLEQEDLPKEFDYHQTCMAANLLSLSERHSDLQHEIRAFLRRRALLPYTEEHLEDPKALLRLGIDHFPASNLAGPGRLPGQLGDFIEQRGLMLQAHVFYR